MARKGRTTVFISLSLRFLLFQHLFFLLLLLLLVVFSSLVSFSDDDEAAAVSTTTAVAFNYRSSSIVLGNTTQKQNVVRPSVVCSLPLSLIMNYAN